MTYRFKPFATLLTMVVMLSAAASQAVAKPPPNEGDEAPELVGFELGEFVLKDYRPIQGEKVRVTFTLHASTHADMAKSFEKTLMRSKMRVRDQVITAMRLAEPEEFEDPDLRLIRRRLYLRLGRALPELPIEEVYFSDFRYLVN